MVCPLLVRVGEAEEQALVPGARQDLQSRGVRAPGESHGHGDGWHPGGGRDPLAVVAAVLLVAAVDVRGRAQPGGIDDGVQPGGIHGLGQVGQVALALLVVEVVRAGRIPLGRRDVQRRALRTAQTALRIAAELAGLEHRQHVGERGRVSQRPQVDIHVVAEAPARHALALQLRLQVEAEGVDDLGSEPGQLPQRVLEDGDDLLVRVFGVDQGPQDPDAGALEAVRVEEAGVVVLLAPPPRLRVGIGRVVAGHHVEEPGHVLHGAPHRAGDVAVEGKGHDAVAAGEPDRRADAHQRQARGGAADGVAGIAPEPDQAEAGRDPRGGAPARPGRHPVRRVGVAGRVERRAHRLPRAERPLGHVGLGHHDGALLADAAHHEGVVGRHAPGEPDRAGRGHHVVGVEVVLHQDGDAEEGAGLLAGGQRRVQFAGAVEGGGVHHRDRVDALLVGFDAVEVRLHHQAAGGRAREDRLLHPGDGGFHHVDGGGGGGFAGGSGEGGGQGRGRGERSSSHHLISSSSSTLRRPSRASTAGGRPWRTAAAKSANSPT